MDRIPSVKEYKQALVKPPLTDSERGMLVVHYQAPGHTVTAGEMSEKMGWGGNAACRHYGSLARKLRKRLGCELPKPIPADRFQIEVLVSFDENEDQILWVMHDNLARAIEQLNWV